jgi:outer membrane protein OmpA-like peptidoglycan-associated protein
VSASTSTPAAPTAPRSVPAETGQAAHATRPEAAPAAPERQPTRTRLVELDILGGDDVPSFPEGFAMDGECPPAPADADAEIAAQAGSRVPLVEGLTLATTWKRNPKEEYECTFHVAGVRADGVVVRNECLWEKSPGPVDRRICRSDLRAARLLFTAFGTVEVIGEDGNRLPENMVGATSFSLSRDEFAALKANRETSHHYVQIGGANRLSVESRGVLRLEGTGTARIAVNGTPVELPVVRASGEAEMFRFGRRVKGRVKVEVLDDDSFPLLIDYAHFEAGEPDPHFRLHFPKITYPGGVEKELARRKRMVVHGIYFDFNSDRIKNESDPMLKELGDTLARHADWTISIGGHTDDVGDDAYNLRLSERRAAAVVRALVERHGIAPGRLQSAGFGESSPIEPNDTAEGRAVNRRVELVRVEDVPEVPPQ